MNDKELTPSFEAVALSSGPDQTRVGGVISVSAHGLTFVGADTKFEIPYSGMVLESGGANGRLHFFSNPSVPSWRVYSADKKILAALRNVDSATLRESLGSLHKERSRGRAILFSGLLITGLILVALYFLKNPATAFVARQIPRSVEDKVGTVLFDALKTSQGVVGDKKLTEKFRTFVAPLTETLANSGVTPKVFIAHEDELNAFALPGGYVVVNSGLILAAERAEEVMGVVAHEFAHVSERHVIRNLISAIGIYAAFDLLIGNIAGTLAVLTDLGPRLIQMGFSRDFEREADAVGFEYMLQSQIDPQGMVDIFEKFKKQAEDLGLGKIEKSLSFLSTHPSTEERITVLKEKLAMLSPTQYRDFGKELAEIQSELRERIGVKDEKENEEDEV